MKVDTYACDICKVHRKEANHWFKAYEIDSVSSSSEEKPTRGVSVFPWQVKLPQELENQCAHLCGVEHVMQWVGKRLSADYKRSVENETK